MCRESSPTMLCLSGEEVEVDIDPIRMISTTRTDLADRTDQTDQIDQADPIMTAPADQTGTDLIVQADQIMTDPADLTGTDQIAQTGQADLITIAQADPTTTLDRRTVPNDLTTIPDLQVVRIGLDRPTMRIDRVDLEAAVEAVAVAATQPIRSSSLELRR